MKRISKEEYALRIAEVVALRSQDPHLRVGAVVLDDQFRILSTGYNGLAPGREVPDDWWIDRDAKSRFMIHAETNACTFVTRGHGSVIAVTHSPCAACARIIVAHGFKRVIFRTEYDRDPEALEVLRFHGVAITHLPGEQAADVIENPGDICVCGHERSWHYRGQSPSRNGPCNHDWKPEERRQTHPCPCQEFQLKTRR